MYLDTFPFSRRQPYHVPSSLDLVIDSIVLVLDVTFNTLNLNNHVNEELESFN